MKGYLEYVFFGWFLTFFLDFRQKITENCWKWTKMVKKGLRKCFDQLLGACSTRKLVEIHNNCFLPFRKWASSLGTDFGVWKWLELTRSENKKSCLKICFYFACVDLITLPPRPSRATPCFSHLNGKQEMTIIELRYFPVSKMFKSKNHFLNKTIFK